MSGQGIGALYQSLIYIVVYSFCNLSFQYSGVLNILPLGSQIFFFNLLNGNSDN